MSYTPAPRHFTELKAVGGELDGHVLRIIDGPRDVHEPLQERPSFVVPIDQPAAETVEIRYARYTRRHIFAGSREAPESIEYLAPAELSDAEALRLLLERHNTEAA